MLTCADKSAMPVKLVKQGEHDQPSSQSKTTLFVFTSFYFIVSAASLLISSIGAYLIFYYTNVPSDSFSFPIYFDHSETRPTASGAIEPYSVMSGQAYDCFVHLVVPSIQTNQDIGNFMIELGFTAINDVEIIRSSRPAILQLNTYIVSLAKTILSLPLYLMNLAQETQVIKIRLLENLTFGSSNAFEHALSTNLPIPSKYSVILSNQQIRIYHASIVFVAKLSGLRWFMRNFPISSFITFTGLFWAASMSISLIVFFTIITYRNGHDAHQRSSTAPSKPSWEAPLPSPAATPEAMQDDESEVLSEGGSQ